MVSVVHCETSSGVVNDVVDIGNVVKSISPGQCMVKSDGVMNSLTSYHYSNTNFALNHIVTVMFIMFVNLILGWITSIFIDSEEG